MNFREDIIRRVVSRMQKLQIDDSQIQPTTNGRFFLTPNTIRSEGTGEIYYSALQSVNEQPLRSHLHTDDKKTLSYSKAGSEPAAYISFDAVS